MTIKVLMYTFGHDIKVNINNLVLMNKNNHNKYAALSV